jgi:hypothetical protein
MYEYIKPPKPTVSLGNGAFAALRTPSVGRNE